MSKINNKQQGLWLMMSNLIVDHIEIQNKKRTKILSGLVVLHYMLDYLNMWIIIQHLYVSTDLIQYDWPFIIPRCIFAVLFIIFKHPLLFLLNKFSILMQLLIGNPTLAVLQIIAFIVQIIMVGVWSLTKQQRMIHFDSRFQIFGIFLKQLILYTIIMNHHIFKNKQKTIDQQFIFFGLLVLILLIDYSQIYYNSLTKSIFIKLDYILILLVMITIYKDRLNVNYLEYIFTSIFLFIVLGLYYIFIPIERKIYFKLNNDEIKKLSQDDMIQLLIYLKRYIYGDDIQGIEGYLFKLKQQCDDKVLIQKIQQIQQKHIDNKRQLIDNFIFQILKKGSKSSSRLRDLTIYLYSPSARLYSFLDLQNWQHMREYKRIIRQQLNDSTLREAQGRKQLQQLKGLIEQYSRISSILLQQLMKQRIKQRKIQIYGQQLIILLQQLQKIKLNQNIKTKQIKNLINRFYIECLPVKYHYNIQYQSENIRQDYGQIIFGAEQDNYYQILENNNCFIKITYFKKQKYIGKNISEIISLLFLQEISKNIKNLQTNQDQQMKYTYIINNIGFAVICKYKIQAITHKTGRAWKLSLKQQMSDRCILIVNELRQVIGYTQLCRYYGLSQAQRQKILKIQLIDEIKKNTLIPIRVGEQIFQTHQFYIQNDFNLSILDEMKLNDQKLLLLQLRQNVSKVKTVISPILNIQNIIPQFQFHYDWKNNKYTTQQVILNIKQNQLLKQQQKRQIINYGQGITQMRYYQQKIDYKSNFQQQRDCPSLQPHIQRGMPSLSINQFYQKWDRKKRSIPLWFKLSIILVILIVIVSLISGVYYLIEFNNYGKDMRDGIKLTTILLQKFQSVVLLGQMTTLGLYNSELNISRQINNQILYSNELSSRLYNINENIFNMNNGQILLDLLNELNLYINTYLLNNNINNNNILYLLTNKILPRFQEFIKNIIFNYNNNYNNNLRISIIIIISIILLVLYLLIWLLDLRQIFRRRQIAQILKFIDNDDLQNIRNKIIRFKQIWLDNIDNKQYQQQNNKNKQQILPPKHLISNIRLRRRKIFHIIWFTIFIILLIMINYHIDIFLKISNKYINFDLNLGLQSIQLQTIWAEFNSNNPNITIITQLISSAQDHQYGKNTILKSMASLRQVGDVFISNYSRFWQTGDCCNYFNDNNCLKIIGGALSEGANMAICYLNIEQDKYLKNNMTNFSLYSQSTYYNVGLISLYYLPIITNINNDFILQQYNLMQNKYNLIIQYYFIAIILHSFMALLLLIWIFKQKNTNLRFQQLLMIMPFQKLKNFSAFHKYYLKYYAHQ